MGDTFINFISFALLCYVEWRLRKLTTTFVTNAGVKDTGIIFILCGQMLLSLEIDNPDWWESQRQYPYLDSTDWTQVELSSRGLSCCLPTISSSAASSFHPHGAGSVQHLLAVLGHLCYHILPRLTSLGRNMFFSSLTMSTLLTSKLYWRLNSFALPFNVILCFSCSDLIMVQWTQPLLNEVLAFQNGSSVIWPERGDQYCELEATSWTGMEIWITKELRLLHIEKGRAFGAIF